MWQDLRYSVRALSKSPGFTFVAVLVLALGISVNTAIFSLVNALLFRPLPARAPDELRFVYADHRVRDSRVRIVPGLPYHDYQYLLERNQVFADLAAFNFDYAKLRVGNQTQRTNGESVSTNYFEVLGVAPALGRTFAAKESERSSSPVIILSDRLWRSRFAADPQILGRRIALDNGRLGGRGRDYTVIGVMGPEFAGVSNPWQPAQYWVPVVQRIVDTELWCEPEHIAAGASVIVGRLKPGVTTAQARALIAVQGIEVHQLQRQRARRDYDSELVLSVAESRRFGLPFDPRGDVMPRRFAAALIALSAIVMLIAIANLAGLLMARGLTRRAEIAVRMTLGASRWRIVRQLLSESMLLAILGGIAGVLLARVLIGLFVAHTPGEFGFRIPTQVVLDVPIDTRVLLFTTLVCIATAVEMPGIDLEASAAVVLLLAASILLACYIPARRASRVDPMLVLRSE